ncbi:MAG: hypothetical protein KGL45_17015 [Gammaproteobacteria bacterium]|nr:hypothetical protein [Gammaproteobacteria bacterium]
MQQDVKEIPLQRACGIVIAIVVMGASAQHDDASPPDRGGARRESDGKVLWSGTASGEAKPFGRSYELEDYCEVLSDAILNTVSSMLQSAQFQKALSGS